MSSEHILNQSYESIRVAQAERYAHQQRKAIEIGASASGYLEFHAEPGDIFLGLASPVAALVVRVARDWAPHAHLEITRVTVSEK